MTTKEGLPIYTGKDGKTVGAAMITAIEPFAPTSAYLAGVGIVKSQTGAKRLKLEGGKEAPLIADWIDYYQPQVGGYYVVGNSEASFLPQADFEAQFSKQ